MTALPAQLLTGLTEVRLPLALLDQPGLLRKGRVLAERPYSAPLQVAEFGDSLCPEGPRHHQNDNFGVGSLVCLDGRGTLFPTPSFITLIKRPRVSTHPANTAARRERPETAARPGGLSDWLRGSPAIFLPWPLTLTPFGKIRLLEDGFQYQLPSAVLPLPFLSTS